MAASIYLAERHRVIRASRFLGRFLFERRSHLILLDASARCAGLVKVLLLCAVPHHSFVLIGNFLLGSRRWFICHGSNSVCGCARPKPNRRLMVPFVSIIEVVKSNPAPGPFLPLVRRRIYLSIALQLPLAPMRVFAIGVELPDDVPIQRPSSYERSACQPDHIPAK